MTALIDTCVIMDFLQRREPFYEDAYRIMRYLGTETFTGCITAKSATDLYDLIRRCTHSEKESRHTLQELFSLVGLLGTRAEDVLRAISSDISDFEDAVMVETGLRNHVDCIVTRNEKEYVDSALPVFVPSDFVQMLDNEEGK